MTDLDIFRGKPIVKKDKNGEEVLEGACIFQGVDCIYFLPVFDYAFKYIEKNIEVMIEHELIHLLLYKLDEENICHQYDNLFPHLEDLEFWRKY